MATYREHTSKAGVTTVTAVVRVKKGGRILHSEAQTFPDRKQARAWGEARESEIKLTVVRGTHIELQKASSLKGIVERYLEEYDTPKRPFGKSKRYDLNRIKDYEIGKIRADKLTTQDLIDHIRWRRSSDGCGPATAMTDLTWIAVVLKMAKAAWRMDVNAYIVAEARLVCRTQRLVGPAKRRTVRPTDAQLRTVFSYFQNRNGWVPMNDLIAFAILSARRQAEITRLRWDTLNERDHTILVTDVKHPTEKEGNDQVAKLTDGALRVILRQPRTSEFIFPYNSGTISTLFSNACRETGVENLHFHDLRHEGISRLFETGYSIEQVQRFSLHLTWDELKRYTQVKPSTMALRPELELLLPTPALPSPHAHQ